jgi:amphi-Trp domain-containing protein
MAKEQILFSSEEKTNAQHVSDFLRQLADKIQAGQVILKQAGEEVTADIPPNLVLEVKLEEEAKKKGTQRSLEVEIEWMVGSEGLPVKSGVSLG